MKVRFTTTALIEIDNIFAYLAAHNTKAAAAFVEQDEVVILHVRHAARQWPWNNNR